MDINADQQHPTVTVSAGYAHGQLARAFTTALSHPDAATRSRAEGRLDRWRATLAGMKDGSLRIGSRTPVAGLPAWVTPEVLQGGFASGRACAEGPLQPYEAEACRAADIPADRAELFAYSLTEAGLARLWELLDSGRYRVTVPEEAALLTVAWLVRAGEQDAAVELVAVLAPFAARLRFTPPTGDGPAPGTDAVHRQTVGDTIAALERRGPNRQVETQREAMTVWLPFSDELLAHWLETTGPTGRVGSHDPGPHWHRQGAELLGRYRLLAAEHLLCGKHRNPRKNLGALRSALELTVAGEELPARTAGLLRCAVESMVQRRGLPGSERHTALRRAQAEQAAQPSHHALAQVLLARLAELPRSDGLADPAALLAETGPTEGRGGGIPVGTAFPSALHRPVLAATSAPVETLIDRGLVQSAEVLAGLAPQLAAAAEADAHRDHALGALAAAHHRAFAGRRSLLLLDHAHQVRAGELPWVRAIEPHRGTGGDAGGRELALLRRLGGLAVNAFPGTILPNPLVSELAALARRTDLSVPFVEELAADIFMGTFTPKYLAAAKVAADLLEGTLYERYFGIDYAAVRAMPADESVRGRRSVTSSGFSALCGQRAGRPASSWSVAANGTVIEQAQILTTHNLATLVGAVGITPADGWEVLARRAFDTTCRLVTRAGQLPHPLATVKNAAFAWRQLLFHLSLCAPQAREAAIDSFIADHPTRLTPAVTGLVLVAAGGEFEDDGTAEGGTAHRLLGWTVGPHRLLS
ncbi:MULTISPECIES: hypothetical protein [unclassified Kitasatospora]|uniref:hypothetical protein n=1 Tax=unclassified Kitasatospora TaxID=2633591 RepID=UPI00070D8216|nr:MULTISPECIES: hypothetical protein [unclassified Kitasatospora]KQV20104.1 hypothetical protein ASC99_22220 [Kitasatospora sp. Root107]KRB71168.1 hypothetical protein ASE03_24350 [Kitasatospora sp. Root187]